MTKPVKNLGVILGSRLTDYVAGALPYEIRNPSGDWTPYLPVGEIQKAKEDWMDCVSRSNTNVVEIQEKHQTGIESNYCEREIALGSETSKKGNYLWRVADYGRHTGYAQQATYPDSNGGWDEQYQPIPVDIKAKLEAEKKDWLTKWSVKDEDITNLSKASLQKHLKHAPLQVVVPGHAITLICSPKELDRIFDSYPPYVKNIPGPYYDGPIIAAKKIVLYKKEQAISDEALLVDLKLGDTGRQVEKLLNALDKLGWRLSIKRSNIYLYDLEVAELVMRFKMANVHSSYWGRILERYLYKGREVNATDREIINNLIK